jgi:hypothetical protein
MVSHPQTMLAPRTMLLLETPAPHTMLAPQTILLLETLAP